MSISNVDLNFNMASFGAFFFFASPPNQPKPHPDILDGLGAGTFKEFPGRKRAEYTEASAESRQECLIVMSLAQTIEERTQQVDVAGYVECRMGCCRGRAVCEGNEICQWDNLPTTVQDYFEESARLQDSGLEDDEVNAVLSLNTNFEGSR